MEKQKWLFVFSLLFIGSNLFSAPQRESVEIRNYSSKNVVVNWEFRGGPSEESGLKYLWSQNVCGIGMAIEDVLSGRDGIVRPNQKKVIIQYFPSWQDYDNMDALPFMDKMNSIFKKLEIVCNDGKTIITLENMGERIIKKDGSASEAATYILEIFDYDLVGKPASEW